MKQKRFVGRLAVLTLALCLITMSLASGTLAKYASEVDGNATATVAKWAIKFTDGASTPTEFNDTKKIDLKLHDAGQEGKNLVAKDKIAPGTEGQIDLVVDGTGTEVAYTYSYELDTSGLNGAPIKFYSDSTHSSAITPTGNKITVNCEEPMLTNNSPKTATLTLYWKWDSTGIGSGTSEDARDTDLGKAAQSFTIPVTVKAEQITELPATP